MVRAGVPQRRDKLQKTRTGSQASETVQYNRIHEWGRQPGIREHNRRREQAWEESDVMRNGRRMIGDTEEKLSA